MTPQFALNSSASAMERADAALLEMITLVAHEYCGAQEVLARAVNARRGLHHACDQARAAAHIIHNERRRYQREVGATSLREIA